MDILRHGALEGGVKYRGSVDDPLTADGRHNMDLVWQQIAKDIDLIITSPLTRCAQPAQAWAKAAHITAVVDPRVTEIHYGEWEGKSIPQIQTEYPGLPEKWRENPEGRRPPGGESPEEHLARLKDWWLETCNKHDGKHLLLITHSGSMRMLIAHMLDAPIASTRHMAMPYSCWSRISHNKGDSQLLFHNREVW